MAIYFLSIKKGYVGGGTYSELLRCCSYSLDSDEDEVFRTSPRVVDQVCTEVLDIEGSLNCSLLSEIRPKGKSVSGVSFELSCWYTNAGALSSRKLDEIRSECIDTHYDVRFVSETWLTTNP